MPHMIKTISHNLLSIFKNIILVLSMSLMVTSCKLKHFVKHPVYMKIETKQPNGERVIRYKKLKGQLKKNATDLDRMLHRTSS